MNTSKTFEEFKEILRIHEIETFSKFNVYQNPKGFLDEKREINEDMKLHWKDGLPYFHFGSRIYTCHQGKDKNLGKKRKYAEKREEKQSYNLTQTTKKLDCPASITITRVCALPQFKLENPTKSKKNAVSAKIRSRLKNNEDIEREEVFWFTLPSVDAHKNHLQGEISAVTEPVDPAVRSKIKEFVRDGERNALVISELLEIFVKTDLKQNDRNRRRFFPDIPTIKRIIKEGKRDIRHSKIDTENTEKLLETYDKSDFFFRPFTKDTMNDEVLEDEENNEEWFIEHTQEKLENLHSDGTTSVEVIDEGSFLVSSPCGKKYTVKFNKDRHDCSCTCVDYKRTRLLCKHCLIVGKKFEQYIHKCPLSNPLFCCDKGLFDDSYNQTDSDPIDLDHCADLNVIPQENREKPLSAVAYGELEKRGSKRRKLIDTCNSHLRNLGSVLWMLPESALLELNKNLLDLTEKMQNKVNKDDSTGLPLESCRIEPINQKKETKISKDETKKRYAKKGFSGRVGMQANLIREASKASKIKIRD